MPRLTISCGGSVVNSVSPTATEPLFGLISPLIGGSNLLDGQYSVDSLLLALTGSVAVLLLVNLWRDGELS